MKRSSSKLSLRQTEDYTLQETATPAPIEDNWSQKCHAHDSGPCQALGSTVEQPHHGNHNTTLETVDFDQVLLHNSSLHTKRKRKRKISSQGHERNTKFELKRSTTRTRENQKSKDLKQYVWTKGNHTRLSKEEQTNSKKLWMNYTIHTHNDRQI